MKYFARFSDEEWTIYKTITYLFIPVGEVEHETFDIGEDNRFEYFNKYIKLELERLNNEQ